MTPRHVTLLAAIFVSHLLLVCVQSAPNAALLKLIAAKQSHDNSGAISPSSSFSYVNDYNSPFPSDPSTDDVNELWLDSAGSNPMLMRTGNSLTSAGSPAAEEEGEEGNDSLVGEASKRFHPAAFFGSRGKRLYGDLAEAYAKRFFRQGFIGSRGKRLRSGLVSGGRMGEGEEEEEEGKRVAKRFNPGGFTGVRGKRYLPGLEALFLSQMYKKLDAEKWKRQSLLGFHAARG